MRLRPVSARVDVVEPTAADAAGAVERIREAITSRGETTAED